MTQATTEAVKAGINTNISAPFWQRLLLSPFSIVIYGACITFLVPYYAYDYVGDWAYLFMLLGFVFILIGSFGCLLEDDGGGPVGP